MSGAARPGLALALLLALACGPETADAGSDTAVEPCTVEDIQMRSELKVDGAFCTNCELARSDETEFWTIVHTTCEEGFHWSASSGLFVGHVEWENLSTGDAGEWWIASHSNDLPSWELSPGMPIEWSGPVLDVVVGEDAEPGYYLFTVHAYIPDADPSVRFKVYLR